MHISQKNSFNPLKTFVFSLGLWWISCGWADHKVAILVPAEHQAMEEIIQGIKSELNHSNITVSVYRAHGDLNILSGLIRNIQYDRSDVVIPIGTLTSQMTLASIQDRPVVCTAAQIAEVGTQTFVIDDDVALAPLIDYLKDLKHVAICYSAQDKVIDEVRVLKNYPYSHPVKIHERMIPTLQDLSIAIQSLSPNIQAVVILKDHLMVSAIPAFLDECHQRKIPLIVSDDCSLKSGATLALTISEFEIGQASGRVAFQILQKDQNISQITLLNQPSLLINLDAFQKQNQIQSEIFEDGPWSIVLLNQKDLN